MREIHSKDLAEEFNNISGNVIYMEEFSEIAEYVAKNAEPGA